MSVVKDKQSLSACTAFIAFLSLILVGLGGFVRGTGAGLAYASLGGTHHSVEEMGMLRLLPGLTVMAPGDAMEVRASLKAAQTRWSGLHPHRKKG